MVAHRRDESLTETRMRPHARRRKSRRAVLTLALSLAVGIPTLQGIAVGAWADGTRVGATIINASHSPVGSGGSQTAFSVALPTGAACSRDTTTGRYHVYGYIVHLATNPGALRWDANGPVLPLTPPDNDTHTLYDTTGSPYVAQNTAIHTGQVPQSAAFRLTEYTIDGSRGMSLALPAGTYNVGIACVTDKFTTDKYWNVQLTFARSSNDPNRETWTVVPGSGSEGTGSSASSSSSATLSSPTSAPQPGLPSVTSPSISQDSPGSLVAGAALKPLPKRGGSSSEPAAIAGAAVLLVAALGILLFARIRRAARRASTGS
jgi:hypothetical protein